MGNKKIFNYKENESWTENLHIVSQVGLTMAGCIVFCFFVGRFIDRFLGTGGIFTVLFIVLGIIGGGVVVFRQIAEVTQTDGKHDKDGSV